MTQQLTCHKLLYRDRANRTKLKLTSCVMIAFLLIGIQILFLSCHSSKTNELASYTNRGKPPDNIISLIRMMPTTTNLEVYDIDIMDRTHPQEAQNKEESKKSPDRAELYYGDLSSLLLLPQGTEEALRQIFPLGSRGAIARTNRIDYERLVVYAPRNLPQKAFTELLSSQGFHREGTLENAELWVQSGGIYKIIFIIDQEHIYAGPPKAAMTMYLLKDKRSEAPAGYWLDDSQDFKDLMSLLPDNSYSITIERVSNLDCDASLIAYINTLEGSRLSEQTLMLCKDKNAAEECLEIFR
jgi:hypothetical protein